MAMVGYEEPVQCGCSARLSELYLEYFNSIGSVGTQGGKERKGSVGKI